MSRAKVEAFGRAVRQRRNELGLTQREVAKRSCDRGASALNGSYIKLVEEIERAEHHPMATSTPSLYSAFQIAKGLGVPLSKLVEGIEEEVAL